MVITKWAVISAQVGEELSQPRPRKGFGVRGSTMYEWAMDMYVLWDV
jgi:hypothetical protein